MNSEHSFRPRKTAFHLAFGCIIGYVLASNFPFVLHDTAHANPTPNAANQYSQGAGTVENVVVSYTYETSINSTSGDNALNARAIDFYPNYVLVKASNGTTTLLAVERLQQFNYRPADAK